MEQHVYELDFADIVKKTALQALVKRMKAEQYFLRESKNISEVLYKL